MRVSLGVAAVLLSGFAQAHPLAPALLELRETAPQIYDVLWRTSITRAQRADVAPVLPGNCADTAKRRIEPEDDGLAVRWTMHCAGGLSGRKIAVTGLAGSGINVIVSLAANDRETLTALLDASRPSYVVVPADAAPPVWGAYVALGAEHLLSGLDHVLFVAGLVLLLGARLRRLVVAVSAFTLGHSVTLSLAALGMTALDSAAMELGIALSLLVLAVELARPHDAKPGLFGRHPAAVAGLFGLLHGLGFAGALAEVGLPGDAIPLALFAFNLGIELGQLAVIAGLLALVGLVRRMPQTRLALVRTIPIYAIGSLAAFWCFERAAWFI